MLGMLSKVAAIAAGGATIMGAAAGVAGAEPVAVTFSSTGAEQVFVVPGGVRVLHVVATGGRGGTGDLANAAGGYGARVTADLPVTPGSVLYVEVGGDGVSATGPSGAAAAFNGGGAGGSGGGYYGGAGGGGASDLRTIPLAQAGATLAGRLLVAAGGGGSGGAGNGFGGAAGAAGGAGSGGATGGGAGTITAGGAAGAGQPASAFDSQPTAGALGIGGTGGSVSGQSGGGGGGGGGYYGGGGGAGKSQGSAAAGGGGSSFAAAGAANVGVVTDTTGTPKVVISYEPVATAELTPNGAVFGTFSPGTTSPSQKLSLANTGTLPLKVTGIALSGADAGDFGFDDGCGSAVAPGGSCTLFVRFTPTAAGVRTATLTVNSNAAAGPATVALAGTGAASGGGGGGGGGGGPAPTPVAPVLSALKLDHTTFRAATTGATIAAKGKKKPPTGATITYTLSTPATTTFAIEQQRKGVRSGSRCVAPPKHPKKSAKRSKACTRTVTLETASVVDGAAGARSHRFSGRVKGRRLPAGSYVLRITPKGTTGLPGTARTLRFRIVAS